MNIISRLVALSVIALAVAACMLFAIPAMAVDVDFSGYYRVRGFFQDTQSLNDDARTANAKFDHRFRIQPVSSMLPEGNV